MPLALCLLVGALLAPFFSFQPLMPVAGGLFLFLSGLELDLRGLKKELPVVLKLWVGAFFPPFLIGYVLAIGLPDIFPSAEGVSPTQTAMILAIAMSVSAVPVILKILQELKLLTTSVGRRIVLTATLCDIAAWLLFFPLLPQQGQVSWLVSHFTLLLFFLGIAISLKWVGHLERHKWLRFLSEWVAAPVFFIGVGQALDFSKGVHITQVLIIFVAACASKIIGVGIAAKKASIGKSERRTIALALNARGAMEILLAGLAMRAGLLHASMFTSLVLMALGTTLVTKPLLRFFFGWQIKEA